MAELGHNLGLSILHQGFVLVTDEHDRKCPEPRCLYLALWDWVSLVLGSSGQAQGQKEGFTLNVEHQGDLSGQCRPLAQSRYNYPCLHPGQTLLINPNSPNQENQ